MRHSLPAAASVLALLTATPVVAQSLPELRLGSEVQGAVTAGRETAGQDYRIRLRAGQRLQVDMRSSDVDAYLEIFAEGDPGEALASDDDGAGDGTDARLRFVAPETGVYVVRARALSEDETGAFTLSASERPAPRAVSPGRVAIGREVRGRLTAGDAEDDDGHLFDAYAVRASAGQRVAVLLEADDFDPMLRVGRMREGEFAQVAENDDGAGHGLNAYLIFTASEGGEYLIRATSLSGSGEGDYTLKVEEGPPAPEARVIAVGDSVKGRLNEDSALSNSGGRMDLYRFTGRAGQRVAASLNAEDFDSYLELFSANGESLASDDDSGGELNARLTYTLPTDGDYLLEARAFSDGDGEYELKIEEVAPPPPPVPAAFGQTVQGELAEGDGTDDEGRLFDSFSFTGKEGQRVQVILRSGDFDAQLQLGEAGEEFEALASDDDGLGQGTDSRLTYTLPRDGDYVVRASAYGRDGKGLYSAEFVDRGPEPVPGSLLVGATARGSLTDSDSLTDDGIAFDAYRFRAKADEKLRFTLISNAFDAVVEIGEENDGAFESLAEDDDGLSDTHARLDWTAPRDGSFVVRARSFGANSTGDYVLMVERQP